MTTPFFETAVGTLPLLGGVCFPRHRLFIQSDITLIYDDPLSPFIWPMKSNTVMSAMSTVVPNPISIGPLIRMKAR